jgi:hypothetical protein
VRHSARPCWPRQSGWRDSRDADSAHNARYDAERSAELFCLVCNRLRDSYAAAEERAREFGWLGGGVEPAADETPEADIPAL